jgi:hypothetical protein
MPKATLIHDRKKCRRRSLDAAMRGVEATPVKFYGSAPPEDVDGGTVISASGDLPLGAEAVDRINEILRLPADRRLRENQIYVRYLEAGNTNYVKSRLMFLAPSTLKNIAGAAHHGFAFMNSHRTGGLSSDPEQPLGRTFAGRYETLAIKGGREFHRTLVGFYMVRGQKPNGESGPSTDAMAAGIDAGTIFDVSLGLKGPARLVCDVCDHDLYGRDEDGNRLCPHVPGTRKHVAGDQQEAQRQRGVDDGVATYSIHDATAGEVSAVFDGAVTGAGFRRFHEAARLGRLTAAEFSEGRKFYGPLLEARSRPRGNPKRSVFIMAKRQSQGSTVSAQQLFDQFQSGELDPEDVRVELREDGDEPERPAPRAADNDETRKLREQLAETNRRLEAAEKAREAEAAEKLAERRKTDLAAVDRDADDAVEANRSRLTGETAKLFRTALCRAGRDDLDHPLDGGEKRFAALVKLQEGAPERKETREVVAERKPVALPNYGASGDDEAELDREVREQNAKSMPKGSRIKAGSGA